MIEKKRFYKMAVCFVLCMGILGGFVWFVDPFYHYHEPFLNMPVVLDNAVYQTAGAAKNLTYNSAIIGTSMTENMHTSWFDDEMGWTTMKLSYSGARSNDLQAIFGEIARKKMASKMWLWISMIISFPFLAGRSMWNVRNICMMNIYIMITNIFIIMMSLCEVWRDVSMV